MRNYLRNHPFMMMTILAGILLLACIGFLIFSIFYRREEVGNKFVILAATGLGVALVATIFLGVQAYKERKQETNNKEEANNDDQGRD
jgi:heme/copper-type cytochrome/quinol oxidase subunit 2